MSLAYESSHTMDKSTVLKAFNKHFFDFVDDIISIFPDRLEIETGRNSFESIKRANPTAIVKVWYKYVYVPYHDVIEMGNIDYFLDKDYQADLANLNHPNRVLEIIDTLRNPLKSMSDVNKKHSIKYIQNLCKMCKMYIDLAGNV